jgi:hypothetical protein
VRVSRLILATSLEANLDGVHDNLTTGRHFDLKLVWSWSDYRVHDTSFYAPRLGMDQHLRIPLANAMSS